MIERKLDTKSGKYPIPVYCRLNPVYANAFRGAITIDKHKKGEIERDINAKLAYKNPLEIMREINKDSNHSTRNLAVS